MPHPSTRTCLCGEPTTKDYAPGHDSRHASELALAVHEGALTESDAVRMIPTPATVAQFQSNLATRNAGRYRGRVRTWGAWLDQAQG